MRCEGEILISEGSEALALLSRAVGIPSLKEPKAMARPQPELWGEVSPQQGLEEDGL